MASAPRLYSRALARFPLAAHSVTASALYGGGDGVAQLLEEAFQVQSTGKTQYNIKRTVRMAAFGLLFAGPIVGTWYGFLHRVLPTLRQTSLPASASALRGMYWPADASERSKKFHVVVKVVIDNLLFQLPFLNFYMFTMTFLEGCAFEKCMDRCRRDFYGTWAYSIIFWCPLQVINFSIVPATYTAFTVNVFNGVWTAFLSLLWHHRDYGAIRSTGTAHAAADGLARGRLVE
mmetsp:Transcript_43429/g.120719  ORF Transcript_43429/g.120719 Transcript_43429/m.120719 type:complete len:233 (-) Transcript_43429:23-721(-)